MLDLPVHLMTNVAIVWTTHKADMWSQGEHGENVIKTLCNAVFRDGFMDDSRPRKRLRVYFEFGLPCHNVLLTSTVVDHLKKLTHVGVLEVWALNDPSMIPGTSPHPSEVTMQIVEHWALMLDIQKILENNLGSSMTVVKDTEDEASKFRGIIFRPLDDMDQGADIAQGTGWRRIVGERPEGMAGEEFVAPVQRLITRQDEIEAAFSG